MIQVKCIVSSTKNFLCFFKHLIFNNTKFWTFHNKPFRFILLSSLTSQKITDFLLSIDNLSRINLIGQNPTDGILAPFAISLCSIPFFIQHIRNLGSTVTFFCVPLVNLFDKELNLQVARLQRMRQKYMDMYTDDLISREELNDKLGGTRQELDRLENELKMVSSNLTKGDQMEKILNDTFKQIEDITDVHEMTNVQLKRLIKKIEVDKDGNVDIYLRLLGDLGLNESILVEDECENKTALNSNDQT